MPDKPTGSKLALIQAAGELFAELGVDGTSVRNIAKKANLNIASINYHFGSKENLYAETLLYVLTCGYNDEKEKILNYAINLKENDTTTFEDIIYKIVKHDFNHFFDKNQPLWHSHLIMRTFMKESETLKTIVETVFRPKHEAFKQIIQKENPSISEQQAEIIAQSINGQSVFYSFCRIPLLMFLKKEEFDSNYLDNIAKYIAKTAALGVVNI